MNTYNYAFFIFFCFIASLGLATAEEAMPDARQPLAAFVPQGNVLGLNISTASDPQGPISRYSSGYESAQSEEDFLNVMEASASTKICIEDQIIRKCDALLEHRNAIWVGYEMDTFKHMKRLQESKKKLIELLEFYKKDYAETQHPNHLDITALINSIIKHVRMNDDSYWISRNPLFDSLSKKMQPLDYAKLNKEATSLEQECKKYVRKISENAAEWRGEYSGIPKKLTDREKLLSHQRAFSFLSRMREQLAKEEL